MALSMDLRPPYLYVLPHLVRHSPVRSPDFPPPSYLHNQRAIAPLSPKNCISYDQINQNFNNCH